MTTITEAILSLAGSGGGDVGGMTAEQVERWLTAVEKLADCACSGGGNVTAESPCMPLVYNEQAYYGGLAYLSDTGGLQFDAAIVGDFIAPYSGILEVVYTLEALGGEGVAATAALASVGLGVQSASLPLNDYNENVVAFDIVAGKRYSLTIASVDTNAPCGIFVKACAAIVAPTSGYALVGSGLGRGSGIGKSPKPPAPDTSGIAYFEVAATLLKAGWQVKTEIETGLIESLPSMIQESAWFAYRNGLTVATSTAIDVSYQNGKLEFSGTVGSLLGYESVWLVVDVEQIQDAITAPETSAVDIIKAAIWSISINNS